jgi:O-antigen/teichoic acid export membrane protein
MPALVAGVAILLALLVGQRMLAGQPNGFIHVAQFSIAFRWSLVVLFVPASLSPVMLPFLANLAGAKAHDPFRRLVRANFITLTLATAIPALVLIVARQPVLGLSGSAYRSDTLTFAVMIGATIPVVWNTILSQTALALEAIWAWFVSDLVLALVLIAAALLLIPRYDAGGLALAYGLGYLATCLALVQPVRARLRILRSTA